MPHRRCRQQQAVTFLREIIERRHAGKTCRLPTIRELAARAEVAPATMMRAVRQLRDEGLLAVSHGRGIRTTGRGTGTRRSDAPVSHCSSPLKHETITDALRMEIRSHRYPPGALLPTRAELLERFGCSYRTLNRALAPLLETAEIEHARRGLRVPDTKALRRSGTILVVARGNSQGELFTGTAQTLERVRTLEQGCARHGVAIRRIPCGYEGAALARDGSTYPFARALSRAVVGVVPLGAVVMSLGFAPETPLGILPHFARRGLPVALLIEGNFVERDVTPARTPLTRAFPMSWGAGCGMDVGRYLRQLGHEHIAYIDHPHTAVWSRARLDGLRRVYQGPGLTLLHVTPPAPPRRGIDTHPLELCVGDALSRLGGGAPLPGRFSTRAHRAVRETFGDIAKEYWYRQCLDTVLPAVLRREHITAWVAANDAVAVRCLELLHSYGVAVPERISVVGFDDNEDACRYKLTSYNFNGAAVVSAMIDHLLAPARWDARHVGDDDSPGFVTVRQTVAWRRR